MHASAMYVIRKTEHKHKLRRCVVNGSRRLNIVICLYCRGTGANSDIT